MRADFKVVLDACVLANYGVMNLLLQLAEKPRLYLPMWSQKILQETRKAHVESLSWPPKIADSLQRELGNSFPEAIVSGFEHLISHCTNQEKDRHVLACAIHCKAEVILTFNLKDFKAEALSPWNIVATHPQDYLLMLFEMEPLHVMHQLGAVAQKRGVTIEDHLIDLGRFLPKFASLVLEELES